ncbi:probable 2-oxoadipate dehydrogenase complex component E1 homolog isoform X2 [Prorops nasuta]|uniref:probable 2-oxoadipate dehydrogenase complex component E1 homolog isoform X2 n=1 Tax=Prorops nasuta TaxID=863751 RepID=UPI0034CFF5AD
MYFAIRSISKHPRLNHAKRYYHSENGIYGHRPKPKKQYKVPKEYLDTRAKFSNFYRLVTAYRNHAHKQANINPIAIENNEVLKELLPEEFRLNLQEVITFEGILNTVKESGTVEDGLNFLKMVYSTKTGLEFSYLETEEEREWFAEASEKYLLEDLNTRTKINIATEMLKSQAFDNFLALKFVSLKRYGGEGAESMMAFFYELFQLSSQENLQEIVLCMPHRGRLNLLTGMLNMPPEKVFRKVRGSSEFPDDVVSSGDVVSHLISSTDLTIDNKSLHVTMLRNPSHLEAVNPVGMGKTRGSMQAVNEAAYGNNENGWWSDKILNVQIHGDAAYTGQGVNQECLAFSGAPHFEIGGSIHLIVNNQVGFTTPAERGRSSRYCTDLAKFISAPVIHVNGDYPEMLVGATRLAFEYQRKFRKDVFIDLNCFRRWGHNELDDPSFTNPLIYKIIQNRKSVPDSYLLALAEEKILSLEEGKKIVDDYWSSLNTALKKTDEYVPSPSYFTNKWSTFKQADDSVTSWDTGVNTNLLKFVGNRSVYVKEGMVVHPTLLKSHIDNRLKKIETGQNLDWATAEAMAFGSLLYEGYNVRISGQDVGRGTFSHRHAMLVDQSNGQIYIPLNSMVEEQMGKLEIANSILSEEAVLGFEYGMSIASPNTLTIWEAQFGDFFNGAQTIIDTFISSGETKWMLNSGLTMLLPHGYDGAGPEHSSCRIERFLQLTDSKEDKPDGDNVNMSIVNPTLPSQYFHLLRRQMLRNFRKPLVIATPKILLRHSSATSSLNEFAPGNGFKNIIAQIFEVMTM